MYSKQSNVNWKILICEWNKFYFWVKIERNVFLYLMEAKNRFRTEMEREFEDSLLRLTNWKSKKIFCTPILPAPTLFSSLSHITVNRDFNYGGKHFRQVAKNIWENSAKCWISYKINWRLTYRILILVCLDLSTGRVVELLWEAECFVYVLRRIWKKFRINNSSLCASCPAQWQ